MALATDLIPGAKISLFFDSAFVDSIGETHFQEPFNMKQILDAAGHQVTTFTGNTTASWRSATLGADVLIIPELEKAALPLSQGAMFFIKQFVSNGGTLIINSADGARHADVLNALFDTALAPVASTGNSTPVAGNVAGTTFAGGAAALPDHSRTDALDDVSLPALAKSFYDNAAGDSTVAAFQFGKGQVIFLGWDFFNAAPAPGTRDDGWLDILRFSISSTDFEPTGLLIKGTKQKDKVSVDPTAKNLDSTDRDDVMKLKGGNDKAFGGDGHDVIDGGAGKDKLHGGAADDILIGAKGKDSLWGDAGGDYFIFNQKPGGKHADKVKDFVDGEDMMVLKASKFDGLTPGDMSALQFNSLIEYQATGWLLFDGQKFAKLQSGGLAIDQTDFIVM